MKQFENISCIVYLLNNNEFKYMHSIKKIRKALAEERYNLVKLQSYCRVHENNEDFDIVNHLRLILNAVRRIKGLREKIKGCK